MDEDKIAELEHRLAEAKDGDLIHCDAEQIEYLRGRDIEDKCICAPGGHGFSVCGVVCPAHWRDAVAGMRSTIAILNASLPELADSRHKAEQRAEKAEAERDAAIAESAKQCLRVITLADIVDILTAERDELQALFDLQHRRTQKAEKYWRRAHPGNDNVIPDLGQLIEWLMSQRKGATVRDFRIVEAASTEKKGE